MVHQPVDARVSHLSHDDVTHLIGDVEESVIASILATSATYLEVEQALKWLDEGAELPRLNVHGLTPTAETRLRYPSVKQHVQRQRVAQLKPCTEGVKVGDEGAYHCYWRSARLDR